LKLILSRKGFDSSSGGGPSPILPDGRMISLPIPDPISPMAFGDMESQGVPLGPLVESLTRGKINRAMGAHLDPDLELEMMGRLPGWRASFGQTGAAAGHLKTHRISPGDLFLYFGWFREAEISGGKWRFLKGAPDRHVLFGWLQVAEVWAVDERREMLPDWIQSHPHCHGDRGVNNTIFVAKEKLELPGLPIANDGCPESGSPGSGSLQASDDGCPGSGVFGRIKPELVLTREGVTRCHWALPAWFHPQGRSSVLSYHEKPKRWQRVGESTHLHSVARGQEFVLDVEAYPEAIQWVQSLLGGQVKGC